MFVNTMNILKEFDVKSSNYSTACDYIHVKQHDDDVAREADKEASEYDNLSRQKEPALTTTDGQSGKMMEQMMTADDQAEKHPKKMNLKGDRGSIVLLIFLYLLLGECPVLDC